MGLFRTSAIRVANSLPAEWKRWLKWNLSIPDMSASLQNMARLGFRPKRALDIGAYVGKWTSMCKELWPECDVCMFEPQPDKSAGLKQLTSRLPGVTLKTDVLSDGSQDKVTFYQAESGSSMLAARHLAGVQGTTLPATTLASAVAGTPFESPDLIKIDVQGAELKVFAGGPDVLRRTEVAILEVALIDEYQGCPLFAEVIEFMKNHGLRVYDICTIWRTRRGTMNEADVIFVRDGSALFDPKHYRRD